MVELFIFGVIFGPVVLAVALVERFGDKFEELTEKPRSETQSKAIKKPPRVIDHPQDSNPSFR